MLRSGYGVTVVERMRSLDREYRGEILQPGGMELLAELGVLDGARARGGYPLRRFRLLEQERVLMDIDYRQLPPPFNFLLSIPQRHLLEELLTACGQHDGFRYLPGRSLSALLTSDGGVTGIMHGTGQDAQEVMARCVVGADGRYSKTRRLAGIGYTRIDHFAHDVLWFRVPAGAQPDFTVQVHRGHGNPVLMYDSYPGSVQLGWTLPHRGYRDVAARGVRYMRDEIIRVVPSYAAAVEESVRELTDLTLLDVFAGTADTWVRDGLVLIGDSAHTHGPMGAQGINLAIQDAVELHPVLVAALRADDTRASRLQPFAAARRPDIDAVISLQARQSQALLSQGGLADAVRPTVMRLLGRTPLYAKILNRIAFGRRPIAVRADLFSTPT